jgi:hypothetical protein
MWNANKRDICQLAARDLHAVHSILKVPKRRSVDQQRNKELSTMNMEVWVDLPATRKQCQKTVHWLGKPQSNQSAGTVCFLIFA